MKKLFVYILVIVMFTGVLFAGFQTLLFDDVAFNTSSAFTDTSESVSLKYDEYIGYAFYTDTDSLAVIISVQGRFDDTWTTIKKDTMAKTDARIENYVLRNTTTDYLAGFNQIRFSISATPDDSDTTGTYSLQIVGR